MYAGAPAVKRLVLALCLAACAAMSVAQTAPDIPRFSAAHPGESPPGWQQLPLARYKNDTEYALVADDSLVVLKAVSRNAASLFGININFDPRRFPLLSWRWKVLQGIPSADTRDRKREDAPARLMVSFAGDARTLSTKDRTAATIAESISGQPLPYAELMYVWGGKVAVDSVTSSTLTSRVRMIAVAADDQGIGQWQNYTRNLVEDFRRAFGEEPGNVTAIAVMTDTDNTGSYAETLYGDIRVQAAR